MDRPETDAADAECLEQLVVFDPALASDRLPPLQPPLDPELAQRLQDAQTLLIRVGRLWPPDRSEGTPGTAAPASLGRFRLLRVLGKGGFGIVYLAEDPQLGRQVAVKVPRPEALLLSDFRQRFLREARLAARLQHPHILPVYESGEVSPW